MPPAPSDAGEPPLGRGPGDPGEITQLLRGVEAGETDAEERLLALVYEELRVIARHHRRQERPDHTLQSTDIIHEAYLRLFGGNAPHLSDRKHLYATFARAVRRVLVDHARKRGSAKRGGEVERVVVTSADKLEGPAGPAEVEVLELHEALERLSTLSERQAAIVELRFFAGLDVPGVAEVLGIGPTTVKKEWAAAKAWLAAELAG